MTEAARLASLNQTEQETWEKSWIEGVPPGHDVVTNPTCPQPGFTLPRRQFVTLHHLRCGQARCAESLYRWGAGLDIGYVPAGPQEFVTLSGQLGPQQLILCWPAGPVAFILVVNTNTTFSVVVSLAQMVSAIIYVKLVSLDRVIRNLPSPS